MTINNVTDGLYRYSVHDYTNRYSTSSTALSFSGAKVKVYVGNEVKEFNIPQNKIGTLWEVFVIENGVFKLINELTNHSTPSTVR